MSITSKVAGWQILKRQDDDLLNHLCRVRGFDPGSLEPDFQKHLHDPNLLPDIKVARDLIKQAKKENWRVTIFGDYDADGTPASALLALALAKIGLSFDVVLPTRASGYGLRSANIKEFVQNSQLLITVDTGISSVEEITLAQKLGLKVIILDHHLPPDKLPPADAIIDPHLENSKYPFKDLCGCALAYKLVTALSADFSEIDENFLKWLLDLVAISTVADMMPLIGENRALVHFGLKVLQKNRRVGLQALFEKASVNPEQLTSSEIGFVVGPRLNASGRLDNNRPAYELLVATDSKDARELANDLELANRDRQTLVKSVLAEAEILLTEQNKVDDRFWLVLGENWPSGIIGLVAGKLAWKYHRPVIVATGVGDGEIRGSGRSINRYPLVDGLTSASHLLTSFGGHRQAAGLSLDKSAWLELTKNLKNHASQILTEEDLKPVHLAEAELNEEELTLEMVEKINQLQPFGLGNSQPLLIIRGVNVVNSRSIGQANQHLKLRVTKNNQPLEIIGFNLAERFNKDPASTVDLLGYLEKNTWQDRSTLQLRLVDYQDPSIPIKIVENDNG